MKHILAFLTAIVLMLSLAAGGAAEEITYTGTVTGGSLHLRKEPSASAKVLDTYKKGKEVTVLENDGSWCKVQVGNKIGYMMTQYLDIKASYAHLGWGKTADDGSVLNLRAGAGVTSPIVYKTMSGVALELIEEQGPWYRARIGSVFGWVEKSKVTLLPGDYALGLAAADRTDAMTPARLSTALREFGSAKTMIRSEGDFTYSLASPETGISAVDSAVSEWLQTTLKTFEADYTQNHAGTGAGRYTVEYQALNIDSRYQSLLLLGEYAVGDFRAETALALNIDAQEGALLSNADLFSADPVRALFCLESAATTLLSNPTDGYSGQPDSSWLRYAVLGRDGVQIILPAGLYLPASLGTRRLTLKYTQVADCMALSSQTIRANVRTIDPTRPMIALTFDDGPSEETDRILAVLAEYDCRATFCVIGNKVEAYSDVIKRAIAGGNEIASHTWSHPRLTTLSVSSIKSQLERTSQAVYNVTGGYQIKVLRPPYGAVNKNVRSVCADLGMVIAEWEVDTLDWSTRNTSKTYNAITKGAKNGVIVLCHDLYSTTASAAEKAIPALVEKGYQLVTVSELLSFHKDGPKPGTVYSRVDPENMIGGEQ